MDDTVITTFDVLKRIMGECFGGCCFCCCPPYVNINENQMGVICEFGIYKKTVPPGTYYINRMTETVRIINPTIITDIQRGILTVNGTFKKMLEPGMYYINKIINEKVIIIEQTIITDTERGLLTINGVFKEMLNPGLYFQNVILNEHIKIIEQTIILENEKGILLINGKFNKVLDPGLYFPNVILNETITRVNIAVQTCELKSQEIVTKDTVLFKIYSVLFYKIIDVYKAIIMVKDIDFTLRECIKTMTQQVLSEHELDEIMNRKQEFSDIIKSRVAHISATWGVEILGIDIKDIQFSDDLKETLSLSAKARRISESKIIIAKGEVDAAKLMKHTSDLLSSNAAMQIRHLDAISAIGKSNNCKVIFLPQEYMTKNKQTDDIIEAIIDKEMAN